MARSLAGYAAAALVAVAARFSVAAAAAFLAVAAAGCASSTSDTTVRLLVRDINIRAEGADCAGTGAYTYLHNRARFRILDGEGKALADGRLPPGKAVRTFEEDLEVERIPTYCEFAVPVTVPSRAGYTLVVDDNPAIPLTSNEGFLVAVVPS